MAKQLNPQGADLTPSRYTEQRTPQFVGGSISPMSGNLVPSNATEAARGQTQQSVGQGLTELLEPKTPTTRLAQTTELPDDRPPPAQTNQQPSSVQELVQQQVNFAAGLPSGVTRAVKSLWKKWF